MDPDLTHPQYDDMKEVWELCRDVTKGERGVKAKGSKYLPRLGGQKNDMEEDYVAYKMRAQFFNAMSRTIDAMAGHVFRKQPKVELPAPLDGYQNDINMEGLSLEGFARQSIEEVLEVGRAGILVDYPPAATSATGSALTLEQAKQLGQRPYITLYKTENIINWRMGRINNATKLVQVFLIETYDDAGEEKIQIRELVLTDMYHQIIWRESVDTNKKSTWFFVSDVTPTMNGKPLTDIPFFFLAPKEAGPDVQKPKLEDLANICIGYYRNSADYENALHVVGLPTPWVNGVDDPTNFPDLHLGANTVLKLPAGSEAGFLQCGGEGVAAHKEAMQEKRSEMAAMGAKVLESDKKQVESGDALSQRKGGENSILATLAGSVEMTIRKALVFMALWDGISPEKVIFELNKDYIPSPMSEGMLREWTASYLSGAISYETYFDGLMAGELISEGLTIEEEIARKDKDGPPLGTLNDNAE